MVIFKNEKLKKKPEGKDCAETVIVQLQHASTLVKKKLKFLFSEGKIKKNYECKITHFNYLFNHQTMTNMKSFIQLESYLHLQCITCTETRA